jgi:hypothetical protein
MADSGARRLVAEVASDALICHPAVTIRNNELDVNSEMQNYAYFFIRHG